MKINERLSAGMMRTSNPGSARERSYELRPRGPHALRFSIVSRNALHGRAAAEIAAGHAVVLEITRTVEGYFNLLAQNGSVFH
jgi:hypothetical protein